MIDYRENQRRRMVYCTPKNSAGEALCHLCNKRPGSQMHEIVNRAQTSASEDALRLSFTETLCSWLCPQCHLLAPMRHVEQRLWRRNIETYGREHVLADLGVLVDALGFIPMMNLPEAIA